jgi:hypothetical protein
MYANSGKSIGVQSAAGGQWSDPIVEGSKIDPMSFTDALIQALRRSNLFSAVNPEADPDYVLSPVLLRQSQPVVGLDMTVTLAVHYTLTETNDSSVVVLEREIESRYTATLGDAFVGAKRVAKANEGAVRENLRQLVDQLALTVGSSTGSGPMEDRSRRAASPWPDTSAVND